MLSEKAQENKNKYNAQYMKTHYKRISLVVTPDKYQEIKSTAEKNGLKVNTFIKLAIDEKIKRDSDGIIENL